MIGSTQFDQNFLVAFESLGSEVSEKYKKVIENYQKCIIPFQLKRMKQNQSISFRNTSLQRDKFELLKKIQEVTDQNHRQQYIMETQLNKIVDLEKTMVQLEKQNGQKLSIIEALKITSHQLEETLNQNLMIVRQVQEDKQQVLKDLDSKNNEFNSLLSNYMKEKNAIAEKLNYINDLEQSLIDKQKKIKQQEFYVKKKWEELEQAKKEQKEVKTQVQQPPLKTKRIFSSSMNLDAEHDDQSWRKDSNKTDKNKYEKSEILRSPLKKIVKHHNNEIYDVSFNYNGNIVATCGGDRMIKLYDVANMKSGITIPTVSVSDIFLCVNLDYTGDKLLAGSSDHHVQIFSSSTGKLLHTFVGHGYKVNDVSWSSSKEKCVSGSEDKQIKIWDIEKSTNTMSITCGKPVKVSKCSNIEPIIYSGHSDGSVRVYSLSQSTTPITQIKGIIDEPISSVVVLSNRYELLVASQEGTPIHLFDLKMNKSIRKYDNKNFFNTKAKAEISPTQKYVICGGNDGHIYYWNKDKQQMERRVSGHQSSIHTLKYHFLSSLIASCDKDGNMIIWQ